MRVLIAVLVAVIVALTLTIDREHRKFIEPVIWHVPYTGGEEQLQPDI